MANYSGLISAIQQVITTNGNEEITGAILQQTLIAVVNSLGSDYQFAGIATPATNPGVTDSRVFYVANEPGTYPNFNGLVVPQKSLAFFIYDTTWHIATLIIGDDLAERLDEEINGSPQVTIQWVGTAPNYNDGRYYVNIPSNAAVGDTINLTPVSASGQIYAIVDCEPGDVFTVNIRSSIAKPYGFIDAENKLLSSGTIGTKYIGEQITAPANAKKLILNCQYNEWIDPEFSGGRVLPYKNAKTGLVETINTLSGNVTTLQGDVAQIKEKLVDIDRTKTYITVERTAGQLDFRNVWNNTNIKNEPASSCTIDWGDGTPVVSIVNDDSFKHNYASAGTYTIIITGLKAVTGNLFLRELSYVKNVKLASTLTSVTAWIANGTVMDSISFLGVVPPVLSGSGTGTQSTMNNVGKIIVPNDGLLAYLKNFYFGTVTTGQDWLTKRIVPESPVGFIYKDTEITVGSGGDFETLNDAIQSVSQLYPLYKSGGIKVVIKILSGTVISEQVFVESLDLSWITIKYEDYNPDALNYDSVAEQIANGTIVFDTTSGYNTVKVNGSNFTGVTHDSRGDVCLFRAENGGKLPVIDCVFKLQTAGSNHVCGCLCNRGSSAVIKTLSGFIGFYDGVISNNESSITIREGITMNCSRWGCHSRHNGEVSARSCIATGCATLSSSDEQAAFCSDRVADLDAREAFISSGGDGIRCENTSRANCNGLHIVGNSSATTQFYSKALSFLNILSMYVVGTVSLTVNNGGQITTSNYTGMTTNINVNTLTSQGVIFR